MCRVLGEMSFQAFPSKRRRNLVKGHIKQVSGVSLRRLVDCEWEMTNITIPNITETLGVRFQNPPTKP